MRGMIEGFYGPPWSWEARREVLEAIEPAGMDTYLYAPKDDPKHLAKWREPYDEDALASFRSLADATSVRLGYGISPGLDIDPSSRADRDALRRKISQLVECGTEVVGLCFDDLPPAEGLAEAHTSLTCWLRAELDDSIELFVVPTHYTGTDRTPYLDHMASNIPDEVLIGWTGPFVVNRSITSADAEAWSDAMDGRLPLLWDNTPVNDAFMADRLHTGPLRGRDATLPEKIGGYLANPMIQASASIPPLLSAAAWLRGDDPVEAWRAALGEAQVLAQGCDGQAALEMATVALEGDQAALDELDAWLALAEDCDDGGWGSEVAPWLEQLHAEAGVARLAIRILKAGDDEARRLAPMLMLRWPSVRRLEISVLGGRGGVQPCFGQDADDAWIASAESILAPSSVCDLLVEAAFARL